MIEYAKSYNYVHYDIKDNEFIVFICQENSSDNLTIIMPYDKKKTKIQLKICNIVQANHTGRTNNDHDDFECEYEYDRYRVNMEIKIDIGYVRVFKTDDKSLTFTILFPSFFSGDFMFAPNFHSDYEYANGLSRQGYITAKDVNNHLNFINFFHNWTNPSHMIYDLLFIVLFSKVNENRKQVLQLLKILCGYEPTFLDKLIFFWTVSVVECKQLINTTIYNFEI